MEEHILNAEKRGKLTITDVKDIDSANENVILAVLGNDALTVKGEKLHIQSLDLAEGRAVITGRINALLYTEKKKSRIDESFLKKLLK